MPFNDATSEQVAEVLCRIGVDVNDLDIVCGASHGPEQGLGTRTPDTPLDGSLAFPALFQSSPGEHA
jgi:hypothetical protein